MSYFQKLKIRDSTNINFKNYSLFDSQNSLNSNAFHHIEGIWVHSKRRNNLHAYNFHRSAGGARLMRLCSTKVWGRSSWQQVKVLPDQLKNSI